jgi:alanine racemase
MADRAHQGRDGPLRASAVVDLGAVERNCRRLRSELGPGTALCAVIKADGYGHGALPCAEAALAGGASWLAVAASAEVAELRGALPDVPALTMGALSAPELDVALGAGSEIAAWRGGFAALAAERGAALGVRPRLHVKHDSGMSRLGERDPEAVLRLCEQVAADERLELAAVWTHFATADDRASDFFDRQLESFAGVVERARADHPGLRAHAANSAANLRDPAAHFDMVR